MGESILISADKSDKPAVYKELLGQLNLLLEGELDEIACMANTASAIKEVFGFFWVGFYRVKDEELVLGPFQGSLACIRIGFGKGVCGTSWKENRTLVVSDVDAFPGHIACSSLSKSEIVVPLNDSKGNVRAVLDIDSSAHDDFNEHDQAGLESICQMIEKLVYR